jgi:hypothetical protein
VPSSRIGAHLKNVPLLSKLKPEQREILGTLTRYARLGPPLKLATVWHRHWSDTGRLAFARLSTALQCPSHLTCCVDILNMHPLLHSLCCAARLSPRRVGTHGLPCRLLTRRTLTRTRSLSHAHSLTRASHHRRCDD